ncbi:uncharacterized protein LOC141651232 [Silene latifolia]|uniref:uncharacterized protein LOC141651232 n=1 Tax=Silene latifolia TaxID=37657 RepID=UPI003D76BCA5
MAEDSSCLLCGLLDETHDHLFFTCEFSSRCLQLLSDWLSVVIPGQNTVNWWVSMRFRSLFLKRITGAAICSLFYQVWHARNKCLHESVMVVPKIIIQFIRQVICTRIRHVISYKLQEKHSRLIRRFMS